jgi:hypothetical protein
MIMPDYSPDESEEEDLIPWDMDHDLPVDDENEADG